MAKANAKFMAPLAPSDELAKVVGAAPLPRTEAIKKIWDYIKKEGLQDKTNRRMINADETLKPVFGGKSQISMFELAGLLGKHLK
jgi:chromatin remodeling complex protein RSC6